MVGDVIKVNVGKPCGKAGSQITTLDFRHGIIHFREIIKEHGILDNVS